MFSFEKCVLKAEVFKYFPGVPSALKKNMATCTLQFETTYGKNKLIFKKNYIAEIVKNAADHR